MRPTEPNPTSHPVDRHVGIWIRLRRRVLGMSQDALARQVGITFQQVQKYERGANRVSASKLYEIAQALDVPVSYFFDGLPQAPHPDDAAAEPKVLEPAP